MAYHGTRSLQVAPRMVSGLSSLGWVASMQEHETHPIGEAGSGFSLPGGDYSARLTRQRSALYPVAVTQMFVDGGRSRT